MKQKLFLIFFITSFTANSQSFTLYGDKAFGGNTGETYSRIIKTANNQLVISCETGTNINGDKTDPLCDTLGADIWLLKIDTLYNVLWNKSLGGELTERDPELMNGGNNFIFSCHTYSDSACEKTEHRRDTLVSSNDYWICLVDSNGNKIWDKTLGGKANEDYAQVIRLSTGNYIVAGGSQSLIGGDKTTPNFGSKDYWVIKLDSSGNKLWDKVYGGTGYEVTDPTAYNASMSVLADTGDDFILAGTTESSVSGNISDTSRGGTDIWIIKLDSAGNKIWDKRYGGSGGESSSHIIHTKDKGYILCGYTDSPQGLDVSDSPRGQTDVWVVKLDSLGNKEWDKRYGGNLYDFGVWIEEAPGGGYWVSASTNSDSSYEVSEHPYGIIDDYWIFKIDSAGNKLWDKRFGGTTQNDVSNFVIMPDSSIFLCGAAATGTSPVKIDYGKGAMDIWLVHFKYTDNTTGINENPNEHNLISVYPNPTNGIINLKSKNVGIVIVSVYNLMGEKVYCNKIQSATKTTLDFTFFKTGMYFLKIDSDKFSNTIKFIKQ